MSCGAPRPRDCTSSPRCTLSRSARRPRTHLVAVHVAREIDLAGGMHLGARCTSPADSPRRRDAPCRALHVARAIPRRRYCSHTATKRNGLTARAPSSRMVVRATLPTHDRGRSETEGRSNRRTRARRARVTRFGLARGARPRPRATPDRSAAWAGSRSPGSREHDVHGPACLELGPCLARCLLRRPAELLAVAGSCGGRASDRSCPARGCSAGRDLHARNAIPRALAGAVARGQRNGPLPAVLRRKLGHRRSRPVSYRRRR